MPDILRNVVFAAVLLLSAYSVAKLVFFFVLPYQKRRSALDRAYDGKAYATGTSDKALLVIVAGLTAALLLSGGEPISFLGGLFVGATLIQLFFHAFHAPVPASREAPEPWSPLKRMSYAIQDRPERAWKEMGTYVVIVVAGVILHFTR